MTELLDPMERGAPSEKLFEMVLGALPAALHVKAFKVVQKWNNDVTQISAFAKLLPYIDDESRNHAFESLIECAARLDRDILLRVLPDYIPIVLKSEGPQGVARIGGLCLKWVNVFLDVSMTSFNASLLRSSALLVASN